MPIGLDVEVRAAAPPETVFALLIDVGRLGAWQTEVVEAQVLGGGGLRAGARVREVRRVGGRRVEQLVQVAVHEPPRLLGLRIVEGRVPIHGDWTIEADGRGGTRIRVHAFGDLPLLMRPATPLVRMLARRRLRGQHERLARLAEAEHATS